jgi:hypothetical protein
MRVTIDISDEIHARLKARAKVEGMTMRTIILKAIDALLHSESSSMLPDQGKRHVFPVIRSKRRGSMKLGREGIYEFIDFP